MNDYSLPIAKNEEKHLFEVRITDDSNLGRTYEAINWLYDNDHFLDGDYDINMHGGRKGYTSFHFRSQELAMQFALMFG